MAYEAQRGQSGGGGTYLAGGMGKDHRLPLTDAKRAGDTVAVWRRAQVLRLASRVRGGNKRVTTKRLRTFGRNRLYGAPKLRVDTPRAHCGRRQQWTSQEWSPSMSRRGLSTTQFAGASVAAGADRPSYPTRPSAASAPSHRVPRLCATLVTPYRWRRRRRRSWAEEAGPLALRSERSLLALVEELVG